MDKALTVPKLTKMGADELFEPQMLQNLSGEILIFSIAMGADWIFW